MSIYESFISFTKRELKTYVLLNTSSEVTFLLGMIVSLAEVANLKASFLRNPAPGACIGSTCTRDAYIKGIFSKSACTRVASIRGTCIKSFCTIGAYTEGACAKSVCTKD